MLIVGAGGLAKEILALVFQRDAKAAAVFYDDVSDPPSGFVPEHFDVLTSADQARGYLREVDERFVVAIGNPRDRSDMFGKFIGYGGVPTTLISLSASVGVWDNEIGDGTLIMTNAVVEACNRIGKNVLVHVASLISHDVIVGDHCEIAPNVSLLGGAQIGDRTRLGAGSVVLPNVRIGSDATVGAGAVVTRDVASGSTVVGVPAKSV